MMKIRSGIGYDIHRLKEGSGQITLGGIIIPMSKTIVAHSDGDTLVHAIVDSILGAIGEPDIGQLFPNTLEKNKGRSSLDFLQFTHDLLCKKNFEIINIDCILVTEYPPINVYKDAMRAKIATTLQIPIEDINIKGKSKEKLDAVGRGEAIECFAVSMIRTRS